MHGCKVREISKDHLRIVENPGCAAVIGLPFFAAGIFLILIGLQIVRMENADEVPAWGWPLIFAMGLMFSGVGAVLSSGRSWLDIQISRGSIVKRWGLFLPMKTEAWTLSDYRAVSLRLDAGDSDTPDIYPVNLVNHASGKELRLLALGDYGGAYSRAKTIAEFLSFPFEDHVTDHPHTVVPGRSSGRRGVPSSEDTKNLPLAARPAVMRACVEEFSGEVRMAIPNADFEYSKLLFLGIGLAGFFYFFPGFLDFLRRTETPEMIQWVFLAAAFFFLAGLPGLGVLAGVIKTRCGRTLLIASAEGIKIQIRDAWRIRETVIPSRDILGLDYSTASSALSAALGSAFERAGQIAGPPVPHPDPMIEHSRWYRFLKPLVKSKGVVIKSGKGLFYFGAGLPDEEVYYLYSLIRRAL